MDEITKKIVRLKDDGNLTWREIGDEVGLSASAARSRYRRAIEEPHIKESPDEELEGGVIVIGATPHTYSVSPAQIWEQVFKAQDEIQDRIKKVREYQRIILKPPCMWALLSDFHFGNPWTDYKAAYADAEIIRDTEDAYVGFHGDGIDNWILPKLAHLQRGQFVGHEKEWVLFTDYLNILSGKMLYVVAGNHENWAFSLAGIDVVRNALSGLKVLYHPHEIVFNLEVGPKVYVVKVRHHWRGSSVFNVTHGIEVSWERGGREFDIGIGGHTHIGTFCRDFVRHGKKRWAVLTGTYKTGDEYGTQLGVAPPHGRGCGAFVFDEDGIPVFCEDLERAASYLAYLKSVDKK